MGFLVKAENVWTGVSLVKNETHGSMGDDRPAHYSEGPLFRRSVVWVRI